VQEDKQLASLLKDKRHGVIPLNVVMSPQRGRTTMSFADRVAPSNDDQRPKLTMFAHLEGSRVHKGLYEPFQLPNGRHAFFYYAKGSIQVGLPLSHICVCCMCHSHFSSIH
jgi:hypothetical protein